MGDLIKVDFNQNGPFPINARELHESLDIKSHYKDWFPRMCEYGFEEGLDFRSILSKSTGGRPGLDHEITVNMAKEICMIQRTERGKQIRQYLIEVENAWNSPEMVMARALQMANDTINEYTIKLEAAERFQRQVAVSKNTYLVEEVAKIASKNGIKIGRNRLWEKLRSWGLAYRKNGQNLPYQRYIERGYFEVSEGVRETNKGTFTHYTTRVTGSGQIYIIDRLVRESDSDTQENVT